MLDNHLYEFIHLDINGESIPLKDLRIVVHPTQANPVWRFELKDGEVLETTYPVNLRYKSKRGSQDQ